LVRKLMSACCESRTKVQSQLLGNWPAVPADVPEVEIVVPEAPKEPPRTDWDYYPDNDL
jgi:hypothetical protein